jgi:hypothetical protein
VTTLAVIDWDAVLQVVWVSILAGTGVTAVFAIGIYGATRAVDLRRDGRPADASVFAVVAVAALIGVAAAVAFGIVAMTHK